jgi:hypothetical protein
MTHPDRQPLDYKSPERTSGNTVSRWVLLALVIVLLMGIVVMGFLKMFGQRHARQRHWVAHESERPGGEELGGHEPLLSPQRSDAAASGEEDPAPEHARAAGCDRDHADDANPGREPSAERIIDRSKSAQAPGHREPDGNH